MEVAPAEESDADTEENGTQEERSPASRNAVGRRGARRSRNRPIRAARSWVRSSLVCTVLIAIDGYTIEGASGASKSAATCRSGPSRRDMFDEHLDVVRTGLLTESDAGGYGRYIALNPASDCTIALGDSHEPLPNEVARARVHGARGRGRGTS